MATAADHEAATRIATLTGELLVEARAELFAAGADMWTVRDEGDQRAHDFIIEKLQREFPDDGILSEEGVDDLERLSKERVWIVDPLDGTREFSERGRSDWAVHIALCENGSPTAGAVALPAVGVTLGTDPEPILPPRAEGPPRMVVSRSRATAASSIVAQSLGAEMLKLGSAGAKAMAVVLGHVDIYAHSGGQYEWDNCAPAIVAMAAGCHASRCDGSEMTFNHPDPWLPDFVICRPEFAEDVMGALDEAIRRS
ncbi:MAG: 3'(2'),5'-bisphosphate nucleotidase CysQ [Acidimicrobiales bacterium]|jgi:3'(2'), 5'-bisphosphate nucleotidase